MTRSDMCITVAAVAPNLALVVGLLGWSVWRLSGGLDAFPDGWTPFVLGLSAIVPIASVLVANFVRLRRDAKRARVGR